MQKTVNVQTTGRYQVLGNLSRNTRGVWFVFHGYGMRSEDFVKSFACIEDEQTVIVAPEGLHRFYSKSTRGSVAANWMTKELRESDITNNVSFLNHVLEELYNDGMPENVKLGVLGFSQGGPTCMRWASQLERDVNEMVIWGSDLPLDVVNDIHKLKKVNQSNLKIMVGSDDQYISTGKVDGLIMEMHDKGVDFDFHTFDGKHELHEDSIRYFHARLMDDKTEY